VGLWLLVGVGGAVGSMARYGLSGLVHRYLGMSFPYGTFAVNIIGCLIFGAIASADNGRFAIGPSGRALLLTGVIGGFTTFSAFSFETFALIRDGETGLALLNVGGQIVVGIIAMWAGYTISHTL
jgi:CrcB protein